MINGRAKDGAKKKISDPVNSNMKNQGGHYEK
jgi:hypothetical protein